MTPAAPPLRVGSVPYLVARPLDFGLERAPGIDYRRAVPAQLVRDLRAGELDVALVSSIELFRQPGYRFLPGLAIAGRGHVASVQVFLRRPIREAQSLAMDPASRTAATLTRIMLHGRPGGPPTYREVPLGQDPRSEPCDGWLRIGDLALQELYRADARPVFNPSEQWTLETGLPFVFAAWIVRPGVDVDPHLEAFRRARRAGAAELRKLADDGARTWSLSREDCRHYLEQECLYEGGPELEQALFTFGERAAGLGLAEPGVRPTAWGRPRQPRPIPSSASATAPHFHGKSPETSP